MPEFSNQHIAGGPVQPVYVMNDAVDSPSGSKGAIGGTTSVIGNNSIVAAPGAGYRLVIWSWLIANGAATANTVTIRDFMARFHVPLGAAIGSNMGQVYPFGYRLNENAALTINLSAATAVSYSFIYSVEKV